MERPAGPASGEAAPSKRHTAKRHSVEQRQALEFLLEIEDLQEMAANQGKEPPKEKEKEPKYHLYVRLPFNRGDFVDPPPVNWDETKSEALWNIISGVAKTEIDWTELASEFGVTVEFLLQMASCLTEHHTSQLRAQMRKATATKGSSAPSPIPGSEPAGAGAVPGTAEAMRRTGSGSGRAPSSLSVRKDSPLSKNDGGMPETPLKTSLASRPKPSRNSSSNTTVLAQNPTGAKSIARPGSPRSQRHRLSSFPIPAQAAAAAPESSPGLASPEPALSSSSSSSSSSSPVESRIMRRPPRFQAQDGLGSFADEDEAEPAFLPFQPQASGASSSGQNTQDLGATLRGDQRDFAPRLAKGRGKEKAHQSQTSDSSTSSTAMVSRRPTDDRKPPGPLSPRRAAELSGRSAGAKGKGYSRDGSDGTPSMGSSFSDLDDASVTQSALEEALASKMQDGGTIGSKMSTISQAIRSRYLPKSDKP